MQTSKHYLLGYSFLILWMFSMIFAVFYISNDPLVLISCFILSSATYFLLLKKTIPNLFYWGLGIRLVLLFTTVMNHEYWYLLIGSGQMLDQGLNPYLITQDVLFARIPFYPPLTQWLFWFSAKFQNMVYGVFVLKSVILLGELGVYWMAKKIIQRFNLSTDKLAIYWLNPLVIITLMGSVHFEGIALFFLLFACHCYTTLKDTNGSFNLAFSILSSFASFLFLPLLLMKSGWRRSLKVLSAIILILFFCFLPFFSQGNSWDVLDYFMLIFKQSNFNSISIVLMLLIAYLYRFRNRLSMYTGMLLIQAVYVLFMPFVQAWEFVFLIGFSMFSKYKFPFVWSVIAMVYFLKVSETELIQEIQQILLMASFIWEAKNHFTFKKLFAGIKN